MNCAMKNNNLKDIIFNHLETDLNFNIRYGAYSFVKIQLSRELDTEIDILLYIDNMLSTNLENKLNGELGIRR